MNISGLAYTLKVSTQKIRADVDSGKLQIDYKGKSLRICPKSIKSYIGQMKKNQKVCKTFSAKKEDNDVKKKVVICK